jgi:hypothetical protein
MDAHVVGPALRAKMLVKCACEARKETHVHVHEIYFKYKQAVQAT